MLTNAKPGVDPVDVIVRVHDIQRLPELERALLSLVNQEYAPVHPILVCQRLASDALARVQEAVDKFDWDYEHLSPTILNVTEPAQGDIRSRLLNAGISSGKGRYLAILDFDDYVYEHAYRFLIDKLKETGAAIAFGDTVVKHVHVVGSMVYNIKRRAGIFRGASFSDLLLDNFCTIHSFVADRRAIDARDLRFDESLTRLEDYDFFLRICSQYEANFSGRDTTIGVYNWRIDGTQTVQAFEGDPIKAAQNAAEWNRARERIASLKTSIRAQGGGRQ